MATPEHVPPDAATAASRDVPTLSGEDVLTIDTRHVPTVLPPEELSCPPLLLRRWHVADLVPLTAATQASWQHLGPWMPWAKDVPTDASTLEYLRGAERQWDSGEAFQFAMLQHRSVVGSCGLMRRIGPGGLEIGYWVHVDHVRRGLATTAATALTTMAFELTDTTHVEIHVDATNLPSRAVPAKLGYELVEVRTTEPAAPGQSGQDEVWQVTRDHWPRSWRS